MIHWIMNRHCNHHGTSRTTPGTSKLRTKLTWQCRMVRISPLAIQKDSNRNSQTAIDHAWGIQVMNRPMIQNTWKACPDQSMGTQCMTASLAAWASCLHVMFAVQMAPSCSWVLDVCKFLRFLLCTIELFLSPAFHDARYEAVVAASSVPWHCH